MEKTIPYYNKSSSFKYEIEGYMILFSKLLGEGSYGKVYESYHKRNPSEKLAIKVIDFSGIPKNYRQRVEETFQKEVNSLLNLPHPNIMKFYDMIKTEDSLYLIAELCPEGNLLQFCGKINEQQAFFYLRKIVETMIFAHQNKIIHRDLKPANILIKAGEPKIADFGLSRTMENIENCETMTNAAGSPLYMAPEVISSDKYCSKCDVWSVGVMFYEMIFGETPWTANNRYQLFYKIQGNDLKFPKDKAISAKSKSIITAMLEKDRNKRIDFEGVLTLLKKSEEFFHNKLEKDMNYFEKFAKFMEKAAKNIEISENFGLSEDIKNHIVFLLKKYAMSIYIEKYLLLKESNEKYSGQELKNSNNKNIVEIDSFYAKEFESKNKNWKAFEEHYNEIMEIAIEELYEKKNVWAEIKNPKTFKNILNILEMRSMRKIKKNFKYNEKLVGVFSELKKKRNKNKEIMLDICKKKIEELFE